MMRRMLAAAMAALLAGCSTVPAPRSPRPAAALPTDLQAYYDYPHRPIDATVTPVADRGAYRESLVRFPLAAPEDLTPTEPAVEFEWFESAEPGRRPSIVFNPILGGDYPLERGICRYFAARGFHVALVHRKTLKISPEQPVEHVELLLRQGVIRIRQVVDWMAAQDRVDPGRMASFGISMGAIAGVITAAAEPRLRAHVVALAGGSIPDILKSSHDTLLTKPIARYLRANHLTREELDRRLRAAIRTDPLRAAPYVDRSRVLLYVTLFDRTIGRANAERLRRALGRPATVYLPLGHYTALLALPLLERESLRFLRRRLEITPEPLSQKRTIRHTCRVCPQQKPLLAAG